MPLYPKKKVEIVAESALTQRILGLLDEVGAKGYTLIPHVSGKGNRGVRGEADISGVQGNVLINVIAAEAIALRIIEGCEQLFEHYTGIVSISDVMVKRDEHF